MYSLLDIDLFLFHRYNITPGLAYADEARHKIVRILRSKVIFEMKRRAFFIHSNGYFTISYFSGGSE